MSEPNPTPVASAAPDVPPSPATATVWGLPLAALDRAGATAAVMALIAQGRPAYFITANLHYAMLSAEHPGLAEVNRDAAFLLADGAPLVWASRLGPVRLPERVAGSDLIYDLCRAAAERGHGVYLLGAAPGIAAEAARRLESRYPGLRVTGVSCPEADDLAGAGLPGLLEEIRGARPDLLLVALGQPKGELWLHRHRDALGVPAMVQVGATLDFIAGRMRRAPVFYQKVGLEWVYRMLQEPGRLAPRYARNLRFLASAVAGDLLRPRRPEPPAESHP